MKGKKKLDKDDQTKLFIQLYKNEELLWNSTHDDYHNSDKRHESLKRVITRSKLTSECIVKRSLTYYFHFI